MAVQIQISLIAVLLQFYAVQSILDTLTISRKRVWASYSTWVFPQSRRVTEPPVISVGIQGQRWLVLCTILHGKLCRRAHHLHHIPEWNGSNNKEWCKAWVSRANWRQAPGLATTEWYRRSRSGEERSDYLKGCSRLSLRFHGLKIRNRLESEFSMDVKGQRC